MNQSTKNLAFLKALSEKTVVWGESKLSTGQSCGKHPNFTKYRILKNDFEKILEIVGDDGLLFLPNVSLMGYINGYCVYNLSGKLVLIFGTENLPKTSEFTLKTLFTSVFRKKGNLKLYKQLEKKIGAVEIYKTFEEYSY